MYRSCKIFLTKECWAPEAAFWWIWWGAVDWWFAPGSLLRWPLPWQKSSWRMVCIRESVLRLRSKSGPTFGSRAPFTHCSWDDVTRLIRASEICTHTHTHTHTHTRPRWARCSGSDALKTWREKGHSQTYAETENSSIYAPLQKYGISQNEAHMNAVQIITNKIPPLVRARLPEEKREKVRLRTGWDFHPF